MKVQRVYVRLGVAGRDWSHAGKVSAQQQCPVVPLRIRVWRHGAVAWAHAWTGEILEFAGSESIELASNLGSKVRQEVRAFIRSRRSGLG